MEAINKFPRWALIGLASLGMIAIACIAADAKSKVERAVGNSFEAKTLSEQNQREIEDLKTTTDKILENQERTRREYREDQNKLTEQLEGLLVAVNRK